MPKAKTSITFSPESLQAREFYAEDRLSFFRDCLYVADREGGGVIPFEPLPGQRALMRLRDEAEAFYDQLSEAIGERYKRPVSIQVLKARRGGFSTLIEAEMFHFCEFNKGVNGLVVAHQNNNADNIVQISRRFEQQFPMDKKYLKIPIPKMGEVLEWGEVAGQSWDSRILIATANSRNFARGFGYSFVHLSECAHYGSPDAIAAAKDAAQFAKVIYEESTANGLDAYFHKSWQNAMYIHEVKQHWDKHGALPEKWNGKFKFFWAWHDDSAYRVALTEKQKLQIMNNLTDLERDGVQLYGWTAEQIEWRRRKIAGDCSEQTQMDPEDYFRQEYPSSPDEAFVSSGSSVFPTLYISNMEYNHTKPKFHGMLKGFDSSGAVLQKARNERPDGSPLVIWEEPKPGHQYIIGARSAEGLRHTDYSVAIVFDRTNGEFLREVACYRGQATGIELGDICAWLGFKYHAAYIIPEATRPSTAQQLIQKRYPFVHMRKNEERTGAKGHAPSQFVPGFKAQRGMREMVLDHSQDAFRKEEVFLKSKWCIQEHLLFTNIDGDRRAPTGETDDGVIAAALAIYAHRQSAPTVIVPDDLRKTEMFEDSANARNRYEKELLDAVKAKKLKSERRNKKLVKLREKNAETRLSGLFK